MNVWFSPVNLTHNPDFNRWLCNKLSWEFLQYRGLNWEKPQRINNSSIDGYTSIWRSWRGLHKQGRIQRGAIGIIAPPKTYESIFIHHNFVKFGKQHSRYKAILSSTVLSQRCCEVYFIFLTVAKPLWDLTTK